MAGFNSRFKWVDTQDDLDVAVLEICTKSVLGVDTETAFYKMGSKYERLALLQIAFLVDEGMLDLPTQIQDWHVRPQTYVYVFDCMKKGLNFEGLRECLSSKNVLKVIHNASFDCRVLARHLGIEMHNTWCTMRAEMRRVKRKPSLALLGERYFNLEVDKRDRDTLWEHRPLSEQEKLYAAKDAVLHLWCYLYQKERGYNGMYAHFSEVQDALPFADAEEAPEAESLAEMHLWLKNWIAHDGPKQWPLKDMWIGTRPIYHIWNIEEFAQVLEQIIAKLDASIRLEAYAEEEDGCGVVLRSSYYVDVLRALYTRVVKGIPDPQALEMEAREEQVKKNNRALYKELAEEDEFEREQVKFLTETADTAARMATVPPLAPVRPDYTNVLEFAGQVGRFDLTKKLRRARWTW